jgi:hypothetical protein
VELVAQERRNQLALQAQVAPKAVLPVVKAQAPARAVALALAHKLALTLGQAAVVKAVLILDLVLDLAVRAVAKAGRKVLAPDRTLALAPVLEVVLALVPVRVVLEVSPVALRLARLRRRTYLSVVLTEFQQHLLQPTQTLAIAPA